MGKRMPGRYEFAFEREMNGINLLGTTLASILQTTSE